MCGSKDHIPDRVVAGDAVAVTSSANLVVPEDVSSSSAFGTGEVIIVEGNAQPVPQRTPTLFVLEVKTKGAWGKALHSANPLHDGG